MGTTLWVRKGDKAITISLGLFGSAGTIKTRAIDAANKILPKI